MNSQSGSRFLVALLADSRCPMDAADLEEAVRIATAKSPSAAFDAAVRHYTGRHGSSVQAGYLAFAKGTRWIAILRRDEGQTAFDAAVGELRQVAMSTCPACGSECVLASIENCQTCGKPGCQRCLARRARSGKPVQVWYMRCQAPTEKVDESETIRLVDQLLGLAPQDAVGDVRQAIGFALERHAGQRRLGGEPHVNHVFRVGVAAAEYAKAKMPEQFRALILAATLHDTLEDTPTTDGELVERFGGDVAWIIRALSHKEEKEADEVYLSRVVSGGKLAVLVKRFDRLDNIRALAGAPDEFRAKKVTEVREALPIWRRIDPEGSRQIEEELNSVAG